MRRGAKTEKANRLRSLEDRHHLSLRLEVVRKGWASAWGLLRILCAIDLSYSEMGFLSCALWSVACWEWLLVSSVVSLYLLVRGWFGVVCGVYPKNSW